MSKAPSPETQIKRLKSALAGEERLAKKRFTELHEARMSIVAANNRAARAAGSVGGPARDSGSVSGAGVSGLKVWMVETRGKRIDGTIGEWKTILVAFYSRTVARKECRRMRTINFGSGQLNSLFRVRAYSSECDS